MLDSDTRKHIDDARDVLVGKIPDPKSQVEQITLALIYKFMDDMDRETVEKFKGKPKFFTGKFARYSWRSIFDPKLGGHEMLKLYGEALESMSANPNIPQLFQDIFKNAYLPYRDPETLKLFLKTIDWFKYDHSEKLGDAFEYLLSVLGTQGDAGQFRTPRHIIDFMAECVAPQKNETILDPAAGTAGFLLAAYKHILKTNSGKRQGDKLTPADRKWLAENIVGLDIDPNMVRLALANMYLHGFANPKIFEYDTLTSEERWGERYDVIMANPPFMTPKGGIRPHKRFGVQANRSEILFTDYIAEHLTPNGRAGVIVPNGIVATTQTAYKQLRKLLVDEYLIAVVSLPAGVFNPYSGVKTSILLLDKRLAKKTDKVLFLKIENDGYDLGAQRKEIGGSDLPEGTEIFKAFKKSVEEGKEFESKSKLFQPVERKTILESKDISLSGDRYLKTEKGLSKFEIVSLNEVCDVITDGTHYTPTYSDSGYIFLSSKNVTSRKIDWDNVKYVAEKLHNELQKRVSPKLNDILLAKNGTTGIAAIVDRDIVFDIYVSLALLRPSEKIIPKYLLFLINSDLVKRQFNKRLIGVGVPNLHLREIKEVEIPLPPLEVQREIVAEVEKYQNDIKDFQNQIAGKEQKIKSRIAEVWGEKSEL